MKAPSTMASAPPAAAPKPATVSLSMLVQASSFVSIRPEERASMVTGADTPQAPVIRAQIARAARSLAMVRK